MRLYKATSAWLVDNASGPAPDFRSVTIARRNATPTKTVADSTIRAATRPNAADSFCFSPTPVV